MIVYHGSCCIVNEPRIINENRALDFGFGFTQHQILIKLKSGQILLLIEIILKVDI